jgi:hypothetical protein
MPQHPAWNITPTDELSLLADAHGERLAVTPHASGLADLYRPVIAWVLVAQRQHHGLPPITPWDQLG